jgi:hypothetical protein
MSMYTSSSFVTVTHMHLYNAPSLFRVYCISAVVFMSMYTSSSFVTLRKQSKQKSRCTLALHPHTHCDNTSPVPSVTVGPLRFAGFAFSLPIAATDAYCNEVCVVQYVLH